MDIKFIADGDMTDRQKSDTEYIDNLCLAGDPDKPEDVETDMYDWGAPTEGKFLLFDRERAVGGRHIFFS